MIDDNQHAEQQKNFLQVQRLQLQELLKGVENHPAMGPSLKERLREIEKESADVDSKRQDHQG